MQHVHEVLASQAVSSVFQPIVDLDTGAVVAYEALARGPVGPLERPDALRCCAPTSSSSTSAWCRTGPGRPSRRS